ncbi:DUF2203 domain-containing protein [Candidatus Peregrinibacteria bacterium]|nr:DUF2203 domain-containing protein [Candidatus Peregrinibacteria bacterium]
MEKVFTIHEATRALALVSPIVSDILRKMKMAQNLHKEVQVGKNKAGVSEAEMLGKLELAEKFLNEIEYHMKELADVGVALKDMQFGTVDFPCMHNGQPVYLCWRPGESATVFWHEKDECFLDRRPVDKSFLTETARA